MISSLHIPLNKQDLLRPVNLIPMGYLLIAIFAFQHYLQPASVNLLLGLVAMPFVWKVDNRRKCSNRYAWATTAMLILCFCMPVKTLLFFATGLALLFFTESFYGKTNLLVLLLILFVSPVFQYIGNVFSFPIRLQLTTIAGRILGWFEQGVEVKGNMITHAGNEFAVDPACMGLNMIEASFLAGIILLGFYQLIGNRRCHATIILFYLAAIFLLNIIANLFRIILLVRFNLQPGTSSHEIAGLACLLFYVLLPAAKLAQWIVNRSPLTPEGIVAPPTITKRLVVTNLLFLLSIFLLSFKVSNSDTFMRFKAASNTQVSDYAVSSPAPGIVKLEKAGALAYIKYIRGFYDTEHNPMLCWVGSGYQFRNVSIETIEGRKVFSGTITNGKDEFYSAWWYDNGKKNTISQFEWRWDLLMGADDYALVNISCSTKENLKVEVGRIVNRGIFDVFFHN